MECVAVQLRVSKCTPTSKQDVNLQTEQNSKEKQYIVLKHSKLYTINKHTIYQSTQEGVAPDETKTPDHLLRVSKIYLPLQCTTRVIQ